MSVLYISIWQIREATLFALSSLSEQLLESEVWDFDFDFVNSLGQMIYMLKYFHLHFQ